MHGGNRSKGQSFVFGCCLLQLAIVSPLQIAVNVGPKLLQLIPEGIEAHLRSPVGDIRRKSTIIGGIIDVGNGNRRGISGKFGNVEHRRAGVSSGDEDTADGIAKAAYETSTAQSEIARIYFHDRGVNTAHHDVAIHLISESSTIPFRVSFHALSEPGIGILSLTDARDYAHDKEFIGIE